MLNSKEIEVEYPLETIREAFFLAYQAASPASGMGMLQARENPPREEIFQNVATEGDYPGGATRSGDNEFYGDYVFGRMLKLRLGVTENGVEVPTTEISRRYQGWANTYGSYEELVETAAENVAEMDEDEIETIDKSYWEKFKDAIS